MKVSTFFCFIDALVLVVTSSSINSLDMFNQNIFLLKSPRQLTCQNTSDILRAEKILDLFFYDLKAYMRFTDFLVEDFEWSAQKLEKKFSTLSYLVESLGSCRELQDQLDFVREVFHLMLNSMAVLIHYNTQDSKPLILLNYITEFIVSIFGLYNSHGVPDITSEGFSSNVRRFRDILTFYKEEFDSMFNLPFGIHYLFNQKLLRANALLMVLENHGLN